MNDQSFIVKTVLLIDDSEIDVLVNRRLMELTRFAENIIITTTAEEALEFFKMEVLKSSEAPDLVLLDMHLPGLDGFDFIEAFKLLPDFIKEKTKIVVLSVFQKQEKLDRVLENKFVLGQLEKPLSQDSLKRLAQWSHELHSI